MKKPVRDICITLLCGLAVGVTLSYDPRVRSWLAGFNSSLASIDPGVRSLLWFTLCVVAALAVFMTLVLNIDRWERYARTKVTTNDGNVTIANLFWILIWTVLGPLRLIMYPITMALMLMGVGYIAQRTRRFVDKD